MADTDEAKNARMLAKLTRELLRQEQFTSLTDLQDALKSRCAALKISCPLPAINDCFRALASNVELTAARPPLKRAPATKAPLVAVKDVSPAEAGAILRSLGVDIRGGQLRPVRPSDASSGAPEFFPDLVEVR